MEFEYDIALSFAGEQREYVEKVAEILFALGIRVFYDKFEEIDMWGKNLYDYLQNTYNKKAKYCAIFISKDYKDKIWTNHERESAQARALISKKEYIIPIKFDETELPGLNSTIFYLDANKNSPEELASKIAKKTNSNIDIVEMINYMREWYGDRVKINQKGTEVEFICMDEDWEGLFPIRLLLEMYRLNLLRELFMEMAVVPI